MSEVQAGDRVDRYVLLELLGSGGMGVVYAANDPELDRRVALKLMQPAKKRATVGEQRLLREARALARLSHPNIVEVYDVGTWEGDVFMAMELIDGQTLSQWWLDADLSWRDLLAVMLQAGRGLNAAHHAGLVHRDFKPANVLIDGHGRTKVLDFGLARAGDDSHSSSVELREDPSQAGDERLTQTGVVVGTPMYMAPEQHTGGPVDARSDQYSFCATVYEGLYRVRPFAGSTARDLAKAKVNARFEKPSVERFVPARVRRAIMRGLAPDPGQRFATMDALLAALDTSPRRARPVALAGVGLAAMGAAALATSGGGATVLCEGAGAAMDAVWNADRKAAGQQAFTASASAYGVTTWQRVATQVDAYAAAWLAQRTEACLATHREHTQPEEALDRRMTCLDRRLAEIDALAGVFADADRQVVDKAPFVALQLTSLSTCEDPVLLASTVVPPRDVATAAAVAKARERLVAADVLERAGRFEAADSAVEQAEAMSRVLDYAPLDAEVLAASGRMAERAGDYDVAKAKLERCAFAATSVGDDKLAADAHIAIVAVVGYRQANYDAARRWARDAQATIDRAGSGGNDVRMLEARLHNNLSLTALRAGRFDEARTHAEASLTKREAVLPADHLDIGTGTLNLGNALTQSGDYAGATAAYQRTLTVWSKGLAESHPDLGGLHHNMSSVAYHQGDVAKAEVHAKRALEILEAAHGPDHPEVAMALTNVANVVEDSDRPRAIEMYSRACKIAEKAYTEDHPNMSICFSNLGALLLEERRYSEARTHFERALRIGERSLGADDPRLAYPAAGLGTCQRELGEDGARALLERALALHKAGTPDPLEIAQTQFQLAQLLAAQGEARRARALGREAIEVAKTSPQPHDEAVTSISGWLVRL